MFFLVNDKGSSVMIELIENIKNNSEKRQGIICIFSEIISLILVAYFLKDYQGSKAEIIIIVTVVCVLSFLLGIFFCKKIVFYRFVFFFLVLTGGLSLLIQPVFNIPDEVAHFARSEIVSRGNIIQNPEEQEFETIQSLDDLYENLKKPYNYSNLKGKKIDYTPTKTKHIASTNLSFLYFPQALGILVAKCLHMDVIWLLWLGRSMNLLCYSLLVAFAIKIAPKLQFPLFFIAALPVSIQQAASFSPDALINGTALLFVGFFLNQYCLIEKKITKKEIFVFALLGTIITISKVTNVFLMGLFLLIPSKRFESRRKEILLKCLAVVVVVLFGSIYYYYTTTFAPNLEHLPYLETYGVDSAEQLRYILENTEQWSREFGYSVIEHIAKSVSMLSMFGWQEYDYSVISVFIVFCFGKICFQEPEICISKFNKGLIVLMAIGIYCTTCFALYLTWSSVGASDIMGVQGRYFIPMLTLFILLFASNNGNSSKQGSYIIDLTIINIMIGASLIVTSVRYY